MEVYPATLADFDEVYPVLQGFGNPLMSREDYRRMLFDLPWPVEEPHRGFMLRDEGSVVGFIGTIFSRRILNGVPRQICHLSSWIVKESHRTGSMQLLLPILGMRSHTLVNPSPNATAYQVFTRLGFRELERAYVLMPPVPRAAEFGHPFESSVITDFEAIESQLDPVGREIARHMKSTLAGQALLRCGNRHCHIIASRSPWKGKVRLAHVLYASDWSLLGNHVGRVSAAFSRTLKTFGLRVESRHLRGSRPVLAAVRPIAYPMLYRPESPDITPEMLDGLYSDLVGHRW